MPYSLYTHLDTAGFVDMKHMHCNGGSGSLHLREEPFKGPYAMGVHLEQASQEGSDKFSQPHTELAVGRKISCPIYGTIFRSLGTLKFYQIINAKLVLQIF